MDLRAAAALLCCLLVPLAACKPAQQAPDANNTAVAENVAAPEPEPTLESATMNRAQLLAAVAAARSAAAGGSDDLPVQRQLDGRRFEVRIRFGCEGPSANLGKAALGWSYEEKSRTMRVRAQPTITNKEPSARTIAGEAVEDVEGFWIPRPWLLDAVCPAGVRPQPPGEEAAELASLPNEDPGGPRIGLAEFFTEADARSARREHRPYESTKVVDQAPVEAKGFNLVLSGRLNALASGKVISCVSAAADRAPDCVASVRFDQVWIEWPDGGSIVAQWSRT